MSGARHILIIDVDPGLCAVLAEQLSHAGEFGVATAQSAAAALEAAGATRPDLVLLGLTLSDMSGPDLCRRLRADGLRAPIVMLTGADDDGRAARDAGATDALAKPIKLALLLTRIRGHLRQHDQSDDAAIQLGPYSFRPAAKLLFDTERQNKRIRLTEKESAILRYLHRAAGKVVARETLLAEVWGYNAAVTTHTLETHIYRLRQKIERDPADARLLLTDAGGYRLAD